MRFCNPRLHASTTRSSTHSSQTATYCRTVSLMSASEQYPSLRLAVTETHHMCITSHGWYILRLAVPEADDCTSLKPKKRVLHSVFNCMSSRYVETCSVRDDVHASVYSSAVCTPGEYKGCDSLACMVPRRLRCCGVRVGRGPARSRPSRTIAPRSQAIFKHYGTILYRMSLQHGWDTARKQCSHFLTTIYRIAACRVRCFYQACCAKLPLPCDT